MRDRKVVCTDFEHGEPPPFIHMASVSWRVCSGREMARALPVQPGGSPGGSICVQVQPGASHISAYEAWRSHIGV